MTEGWFQNDYFIVFDGKAEPDQMTRLYGISQALPGYTLVGLKGWEDFVLRDSAGRHFSVPTVPLMSKYLEPMDWSVDAGSLKPDARFAKRIKWYVKPVVFGGDPTAESNMTWVSLEQHAELVRWWTKFCQDTVAKSG